MLCQNLLQDSCVRSLEALDAGEWFDEGGTPPPFLLQSSGWGECCYSQQSCGCGQEQDAGRDSSIRSATLTQEHSTGMGYRSVCLCYHILLEYVYNFTNSIILEY